MLKGLLERFAHGVEVWAYGSRVLGTSFDLSDIDLVAHFKGDATSRYHHLDVLSYALRESSLPIICDLHDWESLPEFMQEQIKEAYVVLQAAS